MTVWFYCASLVNNKKKKLHGGCFVTVILHKPTAVELSHENQTSTGGEAAQKSRAALKGTETGQMFHVRHGTKPRTRVRWCDGVARSSSAQVEALGCEQLCNGPKGGGQSKEGWLKQELQMQRSAQVNSSDGILTPQAEGRQATTLQTARFTSHWCCVHQALSSVFEFIPSKLKTQHLCTLEQKISRPNW